MTTANLQLAQPAAGSLNWDTPLNANFGLLDSALGGGVSVALTNLPVTLSAAQYQNGFVSFTGTLTGNVVVTFPVYSRIYWLQNNCAANTSFTVTCQTSNSVQYVALPPNEPIAVLCDGTDMKFVGLGRVGTYWDFAGSAVPGWVTASVPPPYLNCDGTAFSSATYPALRDYLGAATLPDARGRFRAALNQTTGRLTGLSSLNGVDGNTLLANGGSQMLGQTNIPSYALSVIDPGHGHSITDPGHRHSYVGGNYFAVYGGGATLGDSFGASFNTSSDVTGITINSTTTGISVNSGGSGNGFAPPSYIGGLTLIRAG